MKTHSTDTILENNDLNIIGKLSKREHKPENSAVLSFFYLLNDSLY